MANRLLTLARRSGDAGSTGLGDGSRVSKADARVAAMGEIDELNSAIGLLLALGVAADAPRGAALLCEVQQDLLELGSELGTPGYTRLRAERVAALERWLETAGATTPRREKPVRPGGSLPAAQAHVCRTVCRRAERSVVELAEAQAVSTTAGQYLNRLSDVLLAMARLLDRPSISSRR